MALVDRLGTPDTEPVRRSAALAAGFQFVVAFCGALAAALKVMEETGGVTTLGIVIAFLGAVATAGGLAIPTILAAEKARGTVWSPASVDVVMDAESVIALREQE